MLTVDCGNSTIRCVDDAGRSWSTPTSAPAFASLAAFVGDATQRVVAVSVVPEALAAVTDAFERLGRRVEVAA